MEYKKLGSSEIKISVYGLGTWPTGGHGWAGQGDQEAISTIHGALDMGVTFFDTAPVYERARAEEVLGQALESHRQDVIISTKYGLFPGKENIHGSGIVDARRQSVVRSVEASLKKLRTDYIDILFQHWPDPQTPLEESLGAAYELVKAGKVRHLGVSNFGRDLLKEALALAPIVAVQSHYSILRRDIENDELPYCREKGIGMIAWGPLQHGLLTGKYSPDYKFDPDDSRPKDPPEFGFQGEGYFHNLRIVEKLRPLAAARGITLTQLAIAWVLSNPAIQCAIVGAKTRTQLESNLNGAVYALSAEEQEAIRRIAETTD